MRTFLRPEDLHGLVAQQFGAGRRLAALDRLSGGSKKGVYRLRLDDATTSILYLWTATENYWPASATVPDDPFIDASGLDLFATNHMALSAAGVRVPRLLLLDRDRRHLDADLALVEDVGDLRLDALIQRDPPAAAACLSALGEALRRMHTTTGPRYGKLTLIAAGPASPAGPAGRVDPAGPVSPARRAEDIIVDRALCHLTTAAARDGRLAEAHHRIAAHVEDLRAAVSPRETYGLVHGELGPDQVLVTPTGEPVIIDFEGLVYFDVEWDHAWLQLPFAEAYPALRPVDLDPDRVRLYRYAQVLSLIEGPLRIADTDFPDRDWMLDLAEQNISKALAAL
jgi:tRNA A-37 threonylcarbamoyl transferase component Bud32